MGRAYVASVLMAITGQNQPAKVAESELAPITPGAWAAWSKSWDAQENASDAPSEPKRSIAFPKLQPAGEEA